ncbi:MAG TPA: PAS domain-containing protein [Steroidobacteraceae bacterium]|nr:PAS domain-containing protein [Steroidobacteraceae bacterium]
MSTYNRDPRLRRRRWRLAAHAQSESPISVAMFEQSSIGMAILDAEGRVTRVNKPFERILGYAAPALRNVCLNEVVYGPDRHRLQTALIRLRSLPEGRYWMRTRYLGARERLVHAITTISVAPATSAVREYLLTLVACAEGSEGRLTLTRRGVPLAHPAGEGSSICGSCQPPGGVTRSSSGGPQLPG